MMVARLRKQLDALERRRGKRKDSAIKASQVLSGTSKHGGGAAAEEQQCASRVEPVVYRRALPRRERIKPNPSAPSFQVRLADVVSGRETGFAGGGNAYLISQAVGDLEGAQAVAPMFSDALATPGSGLRRLLLERYSLPNLHPEEILFMDIESTGLGNSPLFLIGTMIWNGEGFEICGFFARTYAEEAAVIGLFLDSFADKRLLVTFNGKCFDMPYIRARAAVHGIPVAVEPCHVDLLHEARRIWRGRLPDCRLQTLESAICGRARYGDIPGSEIPEAYHAYVRTENACQIAEIVKHNMLDLITMADIMARLPASTDFGT